MSNLTCVVCGKPLSGGSDTFGDIHNPMCQPCHLALWADTEIVEREEAQRHRDRLHMLMSETIALRSEIRYVNNEIEFLATFDKRRSDDYRRTH